MLTRGRPIVWGGLAFLLCATFTWANEPYIYPSQGQSTEQQDQDKYGCYQWAKGEANFDPMQRPTASTAPPTREAKRGGLLRGAAGGAAAGAIVGALTGNVKKGAAIGAGGGAMIGGIRRRDQKRREKQRKQEWASRENAAYDQSRGSYDRAYRACLIGRGYTVQ